MSFFAKLLLFGFGFGKICVTFSKSCHILALVGKISQVFVHIAIFFGGFLKYRKKRSKIAFFAKNKHSWQKTVKFLLFCF